MRLFCSLFLTLTLMTFFTKGEVLEQEIIHCPNTTTPSSSDRMVLDEYCDSKFWGFYVTEIRASWTWWFDYVEDYISPNLRLEGATGVWIASYNTNHPISDELYPVIEVSSGHFMKQVQITYYLNNNATIRIHNGTSKDIILERPFEEHEQNEWLTFTTEISFPEIELITRDPGDFVLIDKVIVADEFEPQTRPTTNATTTTESSNTTNKTMTSTPAPVTSRPGHGEETDDSGGNRQNLAKILLLITLYLCQ